jgi:Tfp pilus assembly protein PilF
LSRLGRYGEARKILFRLNYEDASNVKVNRVLAWTLLLSGKNEQARKMYEDIVSGESVAEDFLNYGYCLWIMKDVASAAGAFSRFVKDSNVGIGLLEDEFNETFNEMLAPHGLSFVDVQLMLYQVSNNL